MVGKLKWFEVVPLGVHPCTKECDKMEKKKNLTSFVPYTLHNRVKFSGIMNLLLEIKEP
jgi:hypothetical protein